MAKASIHIGKKIKEVLDKTPISVVDFAKSINLTRNGAYKVFEKETIDTGQLQAISKVLKHDFFNYYENEPLVLKEPKEKVGYVTKEELAQSSREIIQLVKSEFEKLREELSLKKESYKIPVKKRSTKK